MVAAPPNVPADPGIVPDSGSGSRFTGERPGWGDGFDYDSSRHLAAYLYASTLVAGRRVLDAGCGEGFGTRTLADTAAEVVGVDYSPEAVQTSRRLWCSGARPNLRFELADLSQAGDDEPRAGGSRDNGAREADAGSNETRSTDTAATALRDFDVVLSFQIIEHIAEPRPFLRALAARLAPGGVLVVTTPNRLRTVSENPYHVREYLRDELDRELSAVFADVEIHGVYGNDKVERFERRRAAAVQGILRLDPFGLRRLLPRSLVELAFARLAKVVRRRARPPGDEEIVPGDFSVRPLAGDAALDLMAICRNPRRA